MVRLIFRQCKLLLPNVLCCFYSKQKKNSNKVIKYWRKHDEGSEGNTSTYPYLSQEPQKCSTLSKLSNPPSEQEYTYSNAWNSSQIPHATLNTRSNTLAAHKAKDEVGVETGKASLPFAVKLLSLWTFDLDPARWLSDSSLDNANNHRYTYGNGIITKDSG